MKKITAIIPTYNREATIVRAIESVLNQTYPCHEIIIIDDGSSDRTESLLRPYIDNCSIIYKKILFYVLSLAVNRALLKLFFLQ